MNSSQNFEQNSNSKSSKFSKELLNNFHLAQVPTGNIQQRQISQKDKKLLNNDIEDDKMISEGQSVFKNAKRDEGEKSYRKYEIPVKKKVKTDTMDENSKDSQQRFTKIDVTALFEFFDAMKHKYELESLIQSCLENFEDDEKNVFDIIELFWGHVAEFNKRNDIDLEDCDLTANDYDSFLIFVANILNDHFEEIESNYEENGNEVKELLSKVLNFLLFFCQKTSLYKDLKDYYQTRKKFLFTIYTHYLIYWAIKCKDSECFKLETALDEIVGKTQNFKEEDYEIQLDPKFIQKIYNFCCSELCQPFFKDLIDYCSQQEVQSKMFAANSSWETFKENLLFKTVAGLNDKLIILPVSFDDGKDAETTYDLRIAINLSFKRINYKKKADAILLMIAAHELCHIIRIQLMNDGQYYNKKNPEKFKVSKQVQETKFLPSGEEIGYYFEENYIFFKSLQTLNLFSIGREDAEFLLDESNWKNEKFKQRFDIETQQEQDSSNVNRKKRGAYHTRHTSYHKAQVLFLELKERRAKIKR